MMQDLLTADATVIRPGSLYPMERVRAYLELILRMAAHTISLTFTELEETDVVHDMLQANLPASASLPLNALKEAWDKPSSVPCLKNWR